MHQRIPSPRELQVHTQNIMQRALIKKKLEEQQENFRKKQELQQSGQSPGGISPAKNVGSPTQLAFTPTAVLRKMTADKDEGNKDSANKNNDTQTKSLQQGRAVTGMRNQPTQNQQAGSQTQQSVENPNQIKSQPQWNTQQTQQSVENPNQIKSQPQWNTQFQQMNKQPGRPIVKNNANFQQSQQSQQQAQYDQFLFQQRLMTQQQQQRKQTQQFGGQYGGHQHFANNPQQYSQLPHQLRAQHQQQQPHVRPQQQQQQSSGLNQQWQQIIQHNQSFDNRQIGRGGGNDGDMSPTSNQLARWFSPDLLERARKGKLPNMPASGRAQHALSLEEIERQTAPVIHN
ncbi:Nucleocytoplasmic shuttling protein for mRNA cap-binding EIF4E [Popillia japonica]